MEINLIEMRKNETNDIMNGKQFKEGIVQELNHKKDTVIKEIKFHFKQIYQTLKDAEEKVYNDLIRAFRSINSEMTRLNKEKIAVEKEYEKWDKSIQNFR